VQQKEGRMSETRRKLGQWGEEQAIHYLEVQGCQVVTANWRCAAGEVDIVALDGGCLAFVEVRTRRGQAYGSPEESITRPKLARMAAVAQAYVYEQAWEGDWRLDVVALQVRAGREPAIEWYRNVSM
jgi:putative endonuclease